MLRSEFEAGRSLLVVLAATMFAVNCVTLVLAWILYHQWRAGVVAKVACLLWRWVVQPASLLLTCAALVAASAFASRAAHAWATQSLEFALDDGAHTLQLCKRLADHFMHALQ